MKHNALEIPEALITEDSFTIIWDGGGAQVYVDNMLACKTTRNHFTMTGLIPSQAYHATVVQGERRMEASVTTKKPLRRIDISKSPYDAIPDGKTMNTDAIQRAIDVCGPDDAVCIPRGVFLSGALNLHSNMTLIVDEGGVLLGSSTAEDYLPMVMSRFEGWEMPCYRSLLNAGTLNHEDGYNCCNIAIRGKGKIIGGGNALASAMIDAAIIETGITERPIVARIRGRLITLNNCQNVAISGLGLYDAPAWNVHMIYSDSIITNGVFFKSNGIWNGDGWDVDSSTNCMIFGCRFNTGDDSVSIKSGKNPEGNRIGRPTRNVRIFDCESLGGHGITIGSEMSGGVENVDINHCDLSYTRYGVEIKGTRKRGGYVKNVTVRNCRISRLLVQSVTYNDDGESAEAPPVFSDFHFEDLEVYGRALFGQELDEVPCAVELSGFDGSELKNVTFENVCIGSEDCVRKQIKLAHCGALDLIRVKQLDGTAPEIVS